MRARKLTISAVLSALALVIFVIESQIPPIVAIPGVKLGLANIVILYALAVLGPREAIIILFIKIFLGNLFTGSWVSLFYSAFGGGLCFLAEYIMYKYVSNKELWAVSVVGAIFHNIGQIIVATILLGTQKIIWYLVLLIPVGIITGVFTGFCTTYTLKATEKMSFRGRL